MRNTELRSRARLRFSRRGLLAVLVAVMGMIGATAFAAPAGAERTDHLTRTGQQTWYVETGQQSRSGGIQGMAFLPGELWVHRGDTVVWRADSMEPHTVSFLDAAHPAGPFDPSVGYMVNRTPETTISAPGQFRNSGVLDTVPDAELGTQYRSYQLTFTGTGDYHYICFLHGVYMTGVVHVQDGGRLPYTQHQYDRRAERQAARIIEHGRRLQRFARSGASNHHVLVGAADGTAMVMKMLPKWVVIRQGETIDFDANMNGVPVPHTVTFGPEPQAPVPVGDPTNFHAGDQLSSGTMMPASAGVPNAPSHYRVTFRDAGVFTYICMFHDMMGMRGTVIVLPARGEHQPPAD